MSEAAPCYFWGQHQIDEVDQELSYSIREIDYHTSYPCTLLHTQLQARDYRTIFHCSKILFLNDNDL